MSGKVWLVGAGPGDPRLITVGGLEVLCRADAVVYDRLVSAALVEHAPPEAERHDVGKARGRQRASQADISTLLINLARSGKQVVRLKGGDPFVFGRGGEEALALQAAGVAWEMVPGVSAALAAPALAGIPVTQRDMARSFAVTTGHAGLTQPGLAQVDTLVVLMGVDQLDAVVDTLLGRGRSAETPAALVQWASTPAQRTVCTVLGSLVETARRARIASPATLVIGPTVALSEELNWLERRPLFGRRILVARTRPEPSELTRLLSETGAEVHVLPVRRVVPLRAAQRRETASAGLCRLADGAYDWSVFSGASSVSTTWQALDALGLDARAVRARVAAFGVGTIDALRQYGIRPDWTTAYYQAGDVAAALASECRAGARILLPFVEPMPHLVEALVAGGACVDSIAVGQVHTDEAADVRRLGELLASPGLDMVVLPASRAVDQLADLFRVAHLSLGRTRVVCIGPKTAERARSAGWPVHAVAEQPSRAGLVDLAIQLLKKQTPAGVARD